MQNKIEFNSIYFYNQNPVEQYSTGGNILLPPVESIFAFFS